MARRSDPLATAAALLREIERRKREAQLVRRHEAQQVTEGRKPLDIEALCFLQQVELIRSKARRRVVRASRRAGKTRSFAVALLDRLLTPPYTNVFFLAPTLKRAKRLVLGVLKQLNAQYNLGGEFNDTEGVVSFPHLGADVHVYLGGLKDKAEVDKLRGIPGKLYILDEAQDYREDVLRYALDDVIGPALLDYDGELWVGGTPGALKAGWFYSIDEGDERDSWEHFFWTWRDNTLLPRRLNGQTVAEIEASILEEFGLTPEHPTWIREWCGLWHDDTTNLIWQYDTARNDYDPAGLAALGGKWRYVCGVDLGFEHNDAVTVWGWTDNSPDVYCVFQYRENHESITELAEVLKDVHAQFRPFSMVIDEQGLKKVAHELRKHHGLPLTPAAATEKLTCIELLSDALLTGRAKVPNGTPLVDEFRKAQWDPRAKARNLKKVDESVLHPDIALSAAYALKEAGHYRFKPKPAPIPEHERQLLEAQRDQLRRRELPWWQRDAEDLGYGG